ncbi:glycosyltransferase [Amnibacterium endophyticum]|uniref:Glycosyltransferase n=1 Tax=Amnibacterium endophyticum TaxID=2109337 RepID=A0ABW4L9Q4_9MICO
MSDVVALVSFTIHPTAGSEAGVGWSVLDALLSRSATDRVHLLFDARDDAAVRSGLERHPAGDRVVLHPVPVPGPVLHRYGDARTRQSYLAWLPGARRRLRRLASSVRLDVAHQVTFASAVLPPVLAPGVAKRVVWGPLSVPASASGGAGRVAAVGAAAVRIAEAVAARNVRRADLVIANNDHSRAFVARHGRPVVLEPNIVVERRDRLGSVSADALVMAGHLVPRKRPWLAVRAIADQRLAGLRLVVLGDGPLRAELERLASDLGVADRVEFRGAVSREVALATMSSSRLLVHPSAREGSPWVVGEAAAGGLPAVVMPGSGGEATVRLCDNGGVVAPVRPDVVDALVEGIVEALARPMPEPTDRWSAGRLPGLLDAWYQLPAVPSDRD